VTDAVEPLLATAGLHVHFDSHGVLARAVDGVDLSLFPGEILALVGESGCGKTTLARALLGLVPATSGSVLVRGEALPTRARALTAYRRTVQMVLQDPTGALNPRRTVFEAVAEGVRVHKLGDVERRVADALTLAGLRPPERFFDAYPAELSGGQRQRVVIAGALVLEPQVLIADEPVSSLDASVRGEILALLLRLRDELGLTVVIVTHDLGLAWTVADRIAVMYLGRLVETGTTEEVLEAPKHPYTRALVSVVPDPQHPHRTPLLLAGEPPDPTDIAPGCRFHPRCPAVASGQAEQSGVLVSCRTVDPAVLRSTSTHQAACHLP
jgi:peptide/nickel transport system ATP-binding protein